MSIEFHFGSARRSLSVPCYGSLGGSGGRSQPSRRNRSRSVPTMSPKHQRPLTSAENLSLWSPGGRYKLRVPAFVWSCSPTWFNGVFVSNLPHSVEAVMEDFIESVSGSK